MERNKNLFCRFYFTLLQLMKWDLVKVKLDQLIKKCNLVQMLKILSSRNYFGVAFLLAFSLITTMQSKLHKARISLNIFSFILTQLTQVMQSLVGHHHNFDKFSNMHCQFFQILFCTWKMTLNKKKEFSILQSSYLMLLTLKEDKDVLRPLATLHSLTNNTN